MWFTIFREPVSRLLSAYYYCGYEGARLSLDPLCGSAHFDFHDAGFGNISHIRAFARFWGNFAFRELLLHPALRSRAVASFTPDRYVWWAWKRAILSTPKFSFPDAFRSVADALDHGKLFDVVGVLERFEDTCRLLDSVIPLPKERRYAKAASRNAIQHGSAKYKAEEKAALAVAKMDADVRSALAWDLQLYDEVVLPLFERQMLTIQ